MRGFKFPRGLLVRTLPRHLLFALLSGALTGLLVNLVQRCQLPGAWNYVMLFPLLGIFVNGVMLPVAIPGKHWSFAFIGGMMLVLLLVCGMILAGKIEFQHSRIPGQEGVLKLVNFLTLGAILTGACLGLFYGILAGQRMALVVGAALGAACGYVLGLASVGLVAHSRESWDVLVYAGPLHYAWQCSAAFFVLHLGACLGAVCGAGPTSPVVPAKQL